MYPRFIMVIAAAFSASILVVSVSVRAADVQAGKEIFQGRCAMCHSTEPGVNMIGPSLAGVVGRKAGTAPDFGYSQALKNSGVVWSQNTLNKWLNDPHTFVPGNRMPFPGMASESKRSDIIAYLESLGDHSADR